MDNAFTTKLGTRIHDLRMSQPFASVTTTPATLEITCTYYTETILLVSEDHQHLHGEAAHFLPKEEAPNCLEWDDASWAKYFDQFKKDHHDHLPNYLTVQFCTGWGTTYKNFHVCFHPSGKILYAKYVTNEDFMYPTTIKTLSACVDCHDEADIHTLRDIQIYLEAFGD